MSDAARRAFAGVADDLRLAMALPREAYADPDVFEAEVARVFKTGWIPVARESEIANPGDYRAADLFGLPLVATRDGDGQIHVVSRICRHRGMPLLEGSGNAKGLTCPYHLWRYRLDGRFAAAPAMERSQAFDPDRCDLPGLAVECWGGWVFVNIDGTAPHLGSRIGALKDRLESVDPAGLVTADIIELDSPWNWKVMVENFLESYHHIGPHAGTLQLSNPGLGTYEGQGGDLFTVLENPPANSEHEPFLVAAIFPLTLMFFAEAPMRQGIWYELADIGPATFRLRIHLLTPPEFAAAPEMVAYLREQVMAIHAEDIPVCEGVQKGVTSALYEPGPLSHLEATLWRFHRFLKAQMAAD